MSKIAVVPEQTSRRLAILAVKMRRAVRCVAANARAKRLAQRRP